MNVYDVLEPNYGNFNVQSHRKAALDEWLRSKGGQLSGLDGGELKENILQNCHCAGDFLRIIMNEIAQKQSVQRWIDSTPTNIPHMQRIHRDFPDALFVHIIRDPRDVALSLDKRAWSRPLPWDKGKSLLAAGLYWEWIVRKAQTLGSTLSQQYIEIRYEDLVQKPQHTLTSIGEFLNCDVDYDRIRQRAIGAVKNPPTAFPEDMQHGRFNPVGRWKQKFPEDQLSDFETIIGGFMQQLGYVPSTAITMRRMKLRQWARRAIYDLYYPSKQWLKTRTPLSRWMVNYSEILIDK